MVSVSFSSSHCNLLNFTFFMFPFVVKNKTKNFLPEHLNNHSDNTENKLLLSVFSFRIHSRAFKLWFHNNLSSLQKDNKHYDYLTRDTPETLTLYICMMFLNKLTEALKWCGAHHAVSPSSHRFHLCSVNQKEEEEEEKNKTVFYRCPPYSSQPHHTPGNNISSETFQTKNLSWPQQSWQTLHTRQRGLFLIVLGFLCTRGLNCVF